MGIANGRMGKLGAGALVALALASAAVAGKNWTPGSACNLSFRSEGAVNYFDGEAFNEGSNTVFLDCPFAAQTDASYQKLYVFYNDHNTNAALRCYGYQPSTNAQSRSHSNSRFSCAATDGCSSNSDPGFSSNTVKTLMISGSWMGVTCEVPPGVSIRLLSNIN
jgi:hypothetical protein